MALELKKKRKENDQLLQDSLVNHTLKDEIQKEVKINSLVEQECQEKIVNLQNIATALCRSIEIEKKKNSDLRSIISHLENKIYEDKKGEDSTNDANSDNIESLTKKAKKLEYDIDQIVQKHNQSLAQINQIEQKVNACRTQRVIYSSVFKNIQREIRSSEEEFKKLIIQRIQVEKKRQATLLQYTKNREQQKKGGQSSSKSNEKSGRQQESKINTIDVTTNAFLKDAPKIEQRKFIQLTKQNSVINYKKTNKIKDEISQYEIILNKIKSDTGVEDHKQFLYLLQNIDQVNQNLYNASDQILKKIDEYQQKLKLTNSRHKKGSVHFSITGNRSKRLLPQLKNLAIKFQSKMHEEKSILRFQKNNNLKELLKVLKINFDQQSFNQEEVYSLFQTIEKTIMQTLQDNHTQEKVEKVKIQQNEKTEMLAQLLEHTEKLKLFDKILMPTQLEEQCKKSISDIKENRKSFQKVVPKKKK